MPFAICCIPKSSGDGAGDLIAQTLRVYENQRKDIGNTLGSAYPQGLATLCIVGDLMALNRGIKTKANHQQQT